MNKEEIKAVNLIIIWALVATVGFMAVAIALVLC